MFKRDSSLKQRIFLMVLVSMVPLTAVTICLIHVALHHSVEFGQQELRGNAFQRPLEKILDLLPRLATSDAPAQMDAAMQELAENYNGSLGQALKFSDAELAERKRDQARLNILQSGWNRLKSMPPGTAADELNAELTTSVRTMITHAGDLSNLILDPDLDSYYLMDITLCALPQTQQRLGDALLQLRGGTVPSRTDAAVLAAMLQQSDVDRITGDTQTALSEDKNFYGTSDSLQKNLPSAVEKYSTANSRFIALLNRVAKGETVAIGDLSEAGWSARHESFQLWSTAAAELDILLARRVAAYNWQQWINIGIVALTLAAAAVIISLNIRTLNRKFASLIAALNDNSTTFTTAASQISESSRTLAEGSSEQAASIEQTSASLEQLAAMTRSNSENTQKANELSKETCSAADRGAEDMRAMSAAMREIKNSSDEIAKIIRTIDEIAFQTNILALNAAVEAARAGEAGMGFAVVADEVRTLAQRSAAAARETSAKIESAIASTEKGVALTGKVAEALDGIVSKARQLDELATEVASASREQTQGITQISTASGQMDKVTQGNAATAEECSAAAMELNSQARKMKHVVGDLIGLVNGAAAGAEAENQIKHVELKRVVARRNHQPEMSAPARNEIPMENSFKDF
jgi:methyl-accepting chemotaxis protein